MYIKTPFARDMENAGQKANYDASAKRLLADKQILAWILKCCMPEFSDTDIKEIADHCIIGEPQIARVQGIGVEDVTITEGTVTFDIRFQAVVPRTQKTVSLIINIEAQNNFYPGYPLTKRGIYYCGRMLSSQYGTVFTQSHYEKLKKVYSIWICASPPAYRANTVTTYSIAEKNILGSFREKKKNYDLLTMVMICLGKPESMEHKDNKAETILRLLDVLLSSDLTARNKMCILEQEFSIPMTEQFRKEVWCMCNLSDGVEWKGIKKGIKKGRKEGRKEGRMEGFMESIKSLMQNSGFTMEQSMDALSIPASERRMYEKMLTAQKSR